MKLDEIMNRPAEFKIVRDDDDEFWAEFEAGGRKVVFQAINDDLHYGEGDDVGEWGITFGEVKTRKGAKYVEYESTKSGAEFEVFATIGAVIKKFIKLRKPQKITFTADKTEGNRARLYAKMVAKNLPKGWKSSQEDLGAGIYKMFTLVKEGMMKRSDPYISGEKSGPRPPDEKLASPRQTPHKSKLETLQKKSGKSMEKVEAAWNKAVRETPDGPKKWANVMIRAKADLGISI